MSTDLSWAACHALWHMRGETEVSPFDQLAEWNERAAGDEEIAADLRRIAHTTTEQRHREPGRPAIWLRIDVIKGEIELDILEARPLPQPLGRTTLSQPEVISLVRLLMVTDTRPETRIATNWCKSNHVVSLDEPLVRDKPPALPPTTEQMSLF